MRPLIDADILRYEIGFAAETGWMAITGEERPPPFDYVAMMLNIRIGAICRSVDATEPASLYITEGHTFRYDLAETKPYKGHRKDKKPWHFRNLTAYLRDVLGATVVTSIEADDAIVIEHVDPSTGDTIICSRDKDLRQAPGWFYSWELGAQPAFGPLEVPRNGWLELHDTKRSLSGCGLAFFYAQLLMGDTTDNIPGCMGVGPVSTHNILKACDRPEEQLDAVVSAYQCIHGSNWEEYLLEQGRLCWITRKLHPDGTPVLWEPGMED